MHFQNFRCPRACVGVWHWPPTSWVAQAQTTLRVTAIPDESPTELARKGRAAGQHLEKVMGQPVVFHPVSGLRRRGGRFGQQADRSGLVRGFTFVRPISAGRQGQCPGAARRGRRVSLGVHHQQPCHPEPGRPQGQERELGARPAPSGHLMPRSYLLQTRDRARARLQARGFSARTTPPSPPWRRGQGRCRALNIRWGKIRGRGQGGQHQTARVSNGTTPSYFDYN